jgi:hypothetical protein
MMVDQRILMGYDIVNQGHVFKCYRGQIFVEDRDDRRVMDVVGGLIDVAWELPVMAPLVTAEGDIEVHVVFQQVFTHACLYSEQAWSDLTEVGETV